MLMYDKYQKHNKLRYIGNIFSNINGICSTDYATGCPTEFVAEHIQNAKKALESGNTEEVLNQLELAEEAINAAAAETQ